MLFNYFIIQSVKSDLHLFDSVNGILCKLFGPDNAFGSNEYTHQRTERIKCTTCWAKLASFGHLGLISDPLIVSRFTNGIHDFEGQENNIDKEGKAREAFYLHYIVPPTCWSTAKYVLKKVVLWKQTKHKRIESVKSTNYLYTQRIESVESANYSFGSYPPIVSKLRNANHDSKGQDNGDVLLPLHSCSGVKYVLKKVIHWKHGNQPNKWKCRGCKISGPD